MSLLRATEVSMQRSTWTSSVLAKFGITECAVIHAGPKLRAAGAACILSSVLALSGIPASAHAEPNLQLSEAAGTSYISNQPDTSSIGRQGIFAPHHLPTSAASRKEAFNTMIDRSSSLKIGEKLTSVNQFFNERISYQTDKQAWGQADYWASPNETLTKGVGDCEDFAIAKYYALQKVGVDPEKLSMIYVKSSLFPEPHMVLSYEDRKGADPLVLDNIEKSIKPLSQRRDLTQVYSFNESGLYLPGSDTKISGPERLSKWTAVMAKVANEAPARVMVASNDSKPVDLSMLSTGDLKGKADIGSFLKPQARAEKSRTLDDDGPSFR